MSHRTLGCQVGRTLKGQPVLTLATLFLPIGKLRLRGFLILSRGQEGSVPCSKSPSQVRVKSVLQSPCLPGLISVVSPGQLNLQVAFPFEGQSLSAPPPYQQLRHCLHLGYIHLCSGLLDRLVQHLSLSKTSSLEPWVLKFPSLFLALVSRGTLLKIQNLTRYDSMLTKISYLCLAVS